jgi:hypothetical protein
MSPAALLALVLSTIAVTGPRVERSANVADEVRRWAASSGRATPAMVIPKPAELPATLAHSPIMDVIGRRTLEEPLDIAGRATVGDDSLSGRVRLTDGSAPGATAVASAGLVFPPEYNIDPDLCQMTANYVPQAGDIVLVVSDHLIWQLLFAIALEHEPYHTGIVVQMPDGSFGMLEAGPPDVTNVVRISPLAERLASDRGRVYIRRRAVPLTQEQSEALTGFASRQDGKPYAYIRFLAQGTPLRSRGPIRTHFMGKSRGEPCSYFCSELVIEALVSSGLIDPETARPRATAPCDIFYDESTNPWINTYLKLYPAWWPPQRWIADSCPAAR